MKIKFYLWFTLFVFLINGYAQNHQNLKWWNPLEQETHFIEGQAWSQELESGFDRLPHQAKGKVSEPLWNLSKNSAGLSIRFRSNSERILVKYKLSGSMAMQHMPATGVSGLDLYAKDSDGKWMWVQGIPTLDKNAQFDYSNLVPNDTYHKEGREYQLFLPLYNSVESLEIGVSKNALFIPLSTRKEKPIVVYGTSIAQGACASRPGMAWTAILQRKMDRPLINLGFSGQGLLEDSIIDLMKEIDTKVYILDCLPNLAPHDQLTIEELKNRILNAVYHLREKDNTPILLVDHAGYSDDLVHKEYREITVELNKTMKEAFEKLKSEGVRNLYLLTKEAIGLNLDSTVDGIHPNDFGMQYYANAYEKSLRQILEEPIGTISTTIPVSQSREWNFYKWEERDQELKVMNASKGPKICFFGNSIVHFWGGEPDGPIATGPDSWNKYLMDLGVQNFGFGWDRIENVLWRVYHGELDGFKAEQIVLMLGTNNLHLNSNEEIIEGLDLLIKAIKVRQPKAKIKLVGILPRKDGETRLLELNLLINDLASRNHVKYRDLGDVMLLDSGKINESLFRDGLHPNEKGYAKIAPLLAEYLQN